jgi:hypothetical protein
LLPASIDQYATVGPSAISIDNEILPWELWMWLDEEGLEKTLICFNLSLKLIVLFGSHTRLVGIGHNVIEISRGSIPGHYERLDEVFEGSALEYAERFPESGNQAVALLRHHPNSKDSY